jgi:N-acyl-phosphatidylethanolamine-hydrolysing phospholipase D
MSASAAETPPPDARPAPSRGRAARLQGCSALLLALLLAGCAYVNPYYDAQRPHHTPEGFRNLHKQIAPKNFITDVMIGWRIPAALKGLPPPPQAPTPSVAPDLAALAANALAGAAMRPAATWIGHSTVLLQAGGLNVLTDPIFSERASPVPFAGPKRAQPAAIALDALPPVDVVVISHNHYDHLDLPSVRALAQRPGGGPLFVVPLGVGAFLREQGLERVTELDWWQSTRVEARGLGADIVLLPAQHWSTRSLWDRNRTLWGGYALLADDFHWVYTGDTGYSRDFADIRAHFAARQRAEDGGGFDLALIPIGAYEPRWFMRDQHVDPAEAVAIHRDLGAKRSLGVHWGTFELADEALDEPPRALARARSAAGLPDDAFFVLPLGQTRYFPKRR